MDVRAEVVVRGRVQGVSFRAWTEREALRLGLRGWVRNRPDRAVEAVFEGPREQVEQMVTWCRKGSPAAHVADLQVEWLEPRGEQGFEVRY